MSQADGDLNEKIPKCFLFEPQFQTHGLTFASKVYEEGRMSKTVKDVNTEPGM